MNDIGKIIRKLRLIDTWQIGEHESWLTDMAAQGLILQKLGTTFAQFKKDEPKQINYRIEVTAKKMILDEQIDFYEENGWDYVTSIQNYHVFSSPFERNSLEIHTDPAEQSYIINRLYKRMLLITTILTVSIFFMISMQLLLWFSDGTLTYTLVKGDFIQHLLISFVLVYLTFIMIRGLISIIRLRRNLNDGIPINHHAPWRKTYKTNLIIFCFIMVIAVINLILPVFQLVKDERKTLPEGDVDLPIVRLAEMEENPNLRRDEYFSRDVDFANMINYHWSLVAPSQYETRESGIIPDEEWEDDLAYKPSIHNNVYQLRFAFLADNLIDDLIERYSYETDRSTYVEKEHDDFDLLIVHESNEYSKEVFAAKDKIVFHVQYSGIAELDLLLEQVAIKMKLVN